MANLDFYALSGALAALGTRRVLGRLCPGTLTRLERGSAL